MRDYFIVFFILANLPVGLIRPYYGLLVYTWVSFMYPHLLAWGVAQTFPAAKLSAISAVTGALVTHGGDTQPLRQRETLVMVFLWLTFTISTLFALNPSEAWGRWQDVSKLVIMALLTAMLLKNQKRVRYFLLVIAGSMGFYAVKGGLFSIFTGGEHTIWGPGDSIIAGNNNIGLALNMALPIFWYLAREERGFLRIALYSMFVLSIPSIMFTYARASALTLPIILLAIVLRGRYRTLLLCAILIGVMLAIPFIPGRWWERQKTILDYQSDASAMSRIDNWKFCWTVALDRPLSGAGFFFYTPETFNKYAPTFLYTYSHTWDTHNIYLGILASHGFPGFFAFMLMIGWCFLSCRRMQQAVRDREELRWVATYSSMVQVSFLALLINGMFVNMEYYDLVYDLVAVTSSLKVICYRSVSNGESEESSLTPLLVQATYQG